MYWLASLLPFHLEIIKANRNEFVHVLRLRNCFCPPQFSGALLAWLTRLFWPFMSRMVFPSLQPPSKPASPLVYSVLGYIFLVFVFFNFRPTLHKLPLAICCCCCCLWLCVNNTKPHTSQTVAPIPLPFPCPFPFHFPLPLRFHVAQCHPRQ